jgi:hypothetical protein
MRVGRRHVGFRGLSAKEAISCDSTWCSELWPVFAVHGSPSIGAVQKNAELSAEREWLRFSDSVTVPGTK